ncbi:uncharacterized protein METZ01_LOCUS244888, partial [marine metagenome]
MKSIVLLGGGTEQVDAIKISKELGYNTIVLDSNPLAIGRKFSDKFIQCDIKNSTEVFRNIENLNVNGLMVHAIELSNVVAEVSEKLGFPSIPREVAINATNKLKRLEILKKNHIPCAEFGSAINVNEAKNIAKNIGYPVVIKPVDNAGSRGVIQIKNSEKMEQYFDESIIFCKNKKEIIIEEYLTGPQVSTETVVYKNKCYTTGFSDRNYSNLKKYEPYFIEDGGDMPSNLPDETQKEAIQIAEKAIKSLGINFGAAKGDILIHNNTPYVLEMASRTSGGRFASHQVPAATGVNVLFPLIKMSVSDPISVEEFKPKFNRGSSQRYIIPNPGKIVSVTGVDKARKIEGVVDIILFNDLK